MDQEEGVGVTRRDRLARLVLVFAIYAVFCAGFLIENLFRDLLESVRAWSVSSALPIDELGIVAFTTWKTKFPNTVELLLFSSFPIGCATGALAAELCDYAYRKGFGIIPFLLFWMCFMVSCFSAVVTLDFGAWVTNLATIWISLLTFLAWLNLTWVGRGGTHVDLYGTIVPLLGARKTNAPV